MAGALYLHIPFCRAKCAYCDFASWATCPDDPLIAAYVTALRAQLHSCAQAGLLSNCRTAYVGGGTPSLLGTRLADLISDVRALAPQLIELTCEANPESLTDELLDALVHAKATRLSLGVQSTDEAELCELGRIHSRARALDRLKAAVGTGLDVSADLMCATPGQTDESWQRSLLDVLATGIGHLSAYPLALEEGTPLAQRAEGEGAPWNDPDIQATRMEQAADLLAAEGFHHYEVASYARPDKACAHNISYWTGVPYLGLGTAAASMLDRTGYAQLRSFCTKLPPLADEVGRVRLRVESSDREFAHAGGALDQLALSLEFLTDAQAAAEDLMLAMRMSAGASPELLDRARKVLGPTRVDAALARIRERRLARIANGALVPTHDGWLLGNELYGELWELAPGAVPEPILI